MSKKDLDPKAISLSLNLLIGKIEFGRSSLVAFTVSFVLVFLMVALSRLH